MHMSENNCPVSTQHVNYELNTTYHKSDRFIGGQILPSALYPYVNALLSRDVE